MAVTGSVRLPKPRRFVTRVSGRESDESVTSHVSNSKRESIYPAQSLSAVSRLEPVFWLR
jgi:hypothetical protein